jgi:hypothetical protein
MLNLGGGSAAGALLVTNSNPTDLSSAANLPFNPVTESHTLVESRCYYSGNCHIVPYNSLRGNPYFNVDTRVAKNIKLGENRNLQLIFQGFNLFNHANYGNDFGTTVQSSSFAKPVGFINPTSSLLPRAFTAEFGARFSF